MAAHHLGNNRINALFHPSTLLFSQSKLLEKYVFGTFYICFDKKPGVLCVVVFWVFFLNLFAAAFLARLAWKKARCFINGGFILLKSNSTLAFCS